ncbi:peptide-N4-(N-acetyl-beta-glucosaminyl)asparagine amidase A [Macrophomina phaseolina MS6]|uniref:Peptide-N4-(N-acetyl-beta-glucosaminyl)asparagine amidase A n=1 Tax=Macrophomina phaseolina (strain MS6) TaxID=1126212 RepID=K2SGM8_MACPH|nr:peptide-N4-(N-acetyl-beta-glucosaminyl)asparagine amidase A [Macrophomina phaseolina MS6]
MGNGEIVNGHGPLTLQKALDIARDNESGVDPSVYAFLQRELQSVWSKLLAQPDDYVFTRDEFGLFNYFRQQYDGNEVATKAVQRFWNHYRNADPASRG